MVTRLIRKGSMVLSSYSITVGAGGLGGSAITINNTNGNNGASGGDTIFQDFVTAKLGSGGAGGTTSLSVSGGAGGNHVTGSPNFGPFALPGGSGAVGRTDTTLGNTGANGFTGSNAMPGGGGGRGMSTTTLATLAAGNGGGIYDNGSLVSGGAGGAAVAGSSGANGTDVANKYIYDVNNTLTNALGTGGGGGFPGDLAVTIAGGNGGNGGRGAGGGGGGASRDGQNSGAGGNGGAGVCIVVEFYGA
jgi:hypothetical protein